MSADVIYISSWKWKKQLEEARNLDKELTERICRIQNSIVKLNELTKRLKEEWGSEGL